METITLTLHDGRRIAFVVMNIASVCEGGHQTVPCVWVQPVGDNGSGTRVAEGFDAVLALIAKAGA